MTAEQRLSSFLLDLSQRYAALGYSWREFVLRVAWLEIGSYMTQTGEGKPRAVAFNIAKDPLRFGRMMIRLRCPGLFDQAIAGIQEYA